MYWSFLQYGIHFLHIIFVTQTNWFDYIAFATIKTVEALNQADLDLLINYYFKTRGQDLKL